MGPDRFYLASKQNPSKPQQATIQYRHHWGYRVRFLDSKHGEDVSGCCGGGGVAVVSGGGDLVAVVVWNRGTGSYADCRSHGHPQQWRLAFPPLTLRSFLWACLSVCLSVCLSLCLCLCLFVCLSVSFALGLSDPHGWHIILFWWEVKQRWLEAWLVKNGFVNS